MRSRSCGTMRARRKWLSMRGLPHTFIHAVLVPADSVSPPDIPDLLSWNYCNPCSSWGVVSSASEARIESPLHGSESTTLESGEQLVFARSFDGVPERQRYIEILQKFVHVSGIHHMPERRAWCRLDRRGDIEDVVRVHEIEAQGEYWGGTVVTFNYRLLHGYAALTHAALVWMFDFTRLRFSDFGGWNLTREHECTDEPGIFYRRGHQPGRASYIRGIQIMLSCGVARRLPSRACAEAIVEARSTMRALWRMIGSTIA